MKKILVLIALALTMLLTLTSCDALISGIGEGVVNILPEEIGGVLQEMAPGIFGEKDDPEANIEFIVNTINEGKTLGSFAEAQEEVNTDEIVAEIKAQLAALTGEVAFEAKSDGEKVSGYGAMKDKVIYLAPDDMDEQTYVFIEDDFNLVAVSGSEQEGYYGKVSDQLKELFEMLENGDLEEDIEGDLNEDQLEFIESLMEITLPKASIEDVIYEDGKYYLSEGYIERTISELAEKILNSYLDIYPGDFDKDIYDEFQDAIEDTFDVLDIKLWCYVVCEEFTGMGISVDGADDLDDIDESFEDIEEFHLSIDMNAGISTFDLECKSEKPYELVDINVTVAQTFNEEDKLEKCKVTCSAVVPFEEYDYEDGDYYYDYDTKSIYIYGLTNINFELDMDLNNFEGNGNVLTVKFDSNVSNIEAYESTYYDSEKHYSSEYTSIYSRYENEADFSLNITAEDDGQGLTVDLSVKTKDEFNDDSARFTLEAEISKTAENMPSIPEAVKEARDEALEEYEYTWGY